MERHDARAAYQDLAAVLKAQVDLPRYMEAHGVRLARRQTDQAMAFCCFHEDATPSMSVRRKDGIWVWHCFGCQKKGTVIDFFLGMHPGTRMREVFRSIADWARIPIPSNWPYAAPRASSARPRISPDAARELLRVIGEGAHRWLLWAARTRDQELREAPPAPVIDGLDYLLSRGVTLTDIDTWRLGWLPPGGVATLISEFAKDGPTKRWVNLARRLGLPYEVDRATRGISFSVAGLVIPLLDANGDYAGLSFRSEGGRPKYRNTANIAGLHTMSHYLYGLHRAAEATGPLLVVEGYFDVISACRRGLRAVAVCGSALSDRQAEDVRRLAAGRAVTLAFDGDGPGLQATFNAIHRLTAHGVETRVVRPPDGVDPDTDLRAQGRGEQWEALLERAPEGWAWWVSSAAGSLRRSLDRGDQQTLVENLRLVSGILSRAEESIESLARAYPDRVGEWKAVPAGLALLADRVSGVDAERAVFAAGRLPQIDESVIARVASGVRIQSSVNGAQAVGGGSSKANGIPMGTPGVHATRLEGGERLQQEEQRLVDRLASPELTGSGHAVRDDATAVLQQLRALRAQGRADHTRLPDPQAFRPTPGSPSTGA